MKKSFLLSLFAVSILISACTKDKLPGPAEDYKEIIEKRSVWYMFDEMHQYSDSSDQSVVNDSIHYAVPTGTKYIFKDDKLQVGSATYNYYFVVSNGKNFISIFPEGKPSQLNTFEIISADSKLMKWQQIQKDVSYNNKSGLKGIYKVNFHCPCTE
ncbi:hypothetical protein [Rubrolithibacter danxiaensis]|uniref:hypothetical protein n=1 Tax=Rubrolithibacter danxiaensis TaxID=3390805 RepID=UPI003BF8D852